MKGKIAYALAPARFIPNTQLWYEYIVRHISPDFDTCLTDGNKFALVVWASMGTGEAKVCHLWGPYDRRYGNQIEFLLGHPKEGLKKVESVREGFVEHSREIIHHYLSPFTIAAEGETALASMTSTEKTWKFRADGPFNQEAAETLIALINTLGEACSVERKKGDVAAVVPN